MRYGGSFHSLRDRKDHGASVNGEGCVGDGEGDPGDVRVCGVYGGRQGLADGDPGGLEGAAKGHVLRQATTFSHRMERALNACNGCVGLVNISQEN